MKAIFTLVGMTLLLLLTIPIIALFFGADLQDFETALSDGEIWQAIGLSLSCAAAAVLVSVSFGVPIAYLIARNQVPYPKLLAALFDLPIVIPHPVVGIGLLLIFGRGQLIGSALENNFGFHIASTAIAIVFAMTVVSAPLVVKNAIEGFRRTSKRFEQTAQTLGASPWQAFWRISCPLAASYIRSGALLCWARAISEFGSIVILAYYPKTAPVVIWDRFSAFGLRAAIAPSLMLLMVCLLVFALLQWAEPEAPEARDR